MLNKNDIFKAYKMGSISTHEVLNELEQECNHPLSEGQKGLWALQQIEPSMYAYNVPICFKCKQLDIDTFKKSYKYLLMQYPILTSCIEKENENPVFKYTNKDQFDIEIIDVTGSLESDSSVEDYLWSKIKSPFEFQGGKLIKAYSITFRDDIYLLFVVHHIILDGSSTTIIFNCLFNTYHSLINNQPISISPISTTYDDFVSWELSDSNESNQIARNYWKNKLSNLPALSGMPVTNYGSVDGFQEGEVFSKSLSKTIESRIKKFVIDREISIGVFLFAIFRLVLTRYTGLSDIIIGMPVTNRPQKRFDYIVGHFVNMVPIRSELDINYSFSEYLKKLHQDIFDALDYGSYPFTHQVRDLEPNNRGSLSPIFEISYNFQNFSLNESLQSLKENICDSLDFEVVNEVCQVGEYDLTLDVIPGVNHLLNFKYNPKKYSRSVIKSLSEHFVNLIKAVLKNPDDKMASYSLLNSIDEKKLLQLNQFSRKSYPHNKTCYDLFFEQVVEHASSTAVTCQDTSLTYQQLDLQVTNMASQLQKRGVKSDDHIGICVTRSVDMIISMLAVMKLGAVYIPLDPQYPNDRLSYMIENSNCHFLLCQSILQDKLFSLNSYVEHILFIEDLETTLYDKVKFPSRSSRTKANSLAYIIYTSGSTGKPKGVMIPHHALTNFILSMKDSLGFTNKDKILAVTTYCFDISVLELLLPIITGGRCIISHDDVNRDASLLKDMISKHKPTFLQATPLTWQMLFKVGWKNKENVKVLCGGEALSSSLKKLFFDNNCEVWNMYGPTETTVWSSMKKLTVNDPVTIGKPIANTQIYILDNNNKLMPINTIGNVYISGKGLAKGYYNNSDLTEERFINHPFKKNEKIYNTGDLGRLLENGEIELVGRCDNQVKINGHRIELSDIEKNINDYKYIENSVVAVNEGGISKKLIAFYTINKQFNVKVNEDKLRLYLSNKIPAYMIPESFNYVSNFPKTQNGKIDRNKTSEFLINSSEKQEDIITPIKTNPIENNNKNNVEIMILSIFQEVLSRNNIDASDGFFDIGGDSFSAITIIEKINKHLLTDLKVTSLFKYPSVNSLSSYIISILTNNDEFRQYSEKSQTSSIDEPLIQATFNTDEDTEHPDYYTNSLAIVGISCQLPGAQNHKEYWKNLLNGVESLQIFSIDELVEHESYDRLKNDEKYIPLCGSIEGKDNFDPAFFNISPHDAELMDPQSRLLLQNSWMAVEDAGYSVSDISNTSVFMSTSNNFYQSLFPGFAENMTQTRVMESSDEYVAWLLAQGGSVPTMVSNKLGLTGPSISINSNCSSSLSGIHLASQSLLTNEVDNALVGASTIFPAKSLGYVHKPGLNFSSDGHCRAFDDDADGMVGAEGVAVIMLKRLEDAIRDDDNIYAIMRGVSINNDGSDKAGYYAPSVKGQTDVISKTLSKTQVNPETISYVEAHGTGTKIGDPIEVEALSEAYRLYTKRNQFCGIGSVKSNIGHLDTAAGLAGLIKVVLSLYHGTVPKTINYNTPNKNIDFKNSPFYVVEDNQLFNKTSTPHRAALSSFGIGGTNAHAIFEQYKYTCDNYNRKHHYTSPPFLVVLSAKNESQLKTNAQALLDFIPEYREGNDDLASLAYTLQVGRVAMFQRAAFLIDDLTSLEECISAFLSGKLLSQNSFLGNVKDYETDLVSIFLDSNEMDEVVNNWMDTRNLRKIAKLWVNGFTVDWNKYYREIKFKRVSLPTYCFANDSYWISSSFHTNSENEALSPNTFIENNVKSYPQVKVDINNGFEHSGLSQKQNNDLKPAQIKNYLINIISEELANALKISTTEIDDNRTFANYGLESIAGVELIQILNKRLNIELDTIILYDYPTINKLLEYIINNHQQVDLELSNNRFVTTSEDSKKDIETVKNESIVSQNTTSVMSQDKDPIAIIGMSGRFPKSDDIHEFWEHLESGDDLVDSVNRWDISGLEGSCEYGGFLNSIDKFDSLFFNISGIEAVNMEPQQRIFLEESWKALEDAGYAGEAINEQYCGVYVGCAAGDYLDLNNPDGYPAQALWGNMNSLVPTRISYLLNLHGPAIAIDTACSSSLVAVNMACQALWNNDVDMAISGGIYVQCSPKLYVAGAGSGMLSPTGHCHTFDDKADGFVPAEGVGVLILKRLSDAQSDGDNIHGVIRGIGINQDGSSNGITAPSANSQQRLLQKVYDDFHISCEDIQMIDAHGTGTKLGDPIEFKALNNAFRHYTNKQSFCALGSSKSSIGHPQMAAGVTSIIKVLLSLKHKKIPPTINYQNTNENIILDGSPFYINTELQDWKVKEGTKRCAAVSSFGFSGTNAHAIIEEAPEVLEVKNISRPQLIVASARTENQLRIQIEQLHKFCQKNTQTDIASLSYTLLVGRKHFSKRQTFIANNLKSLTEILKSWLTGNFEMLTPITAPDLSALANDYLTGNDIDTKGLFNDGPYRRISLPTYPFEVNSYWLENDSSLLISNHYNTGKEDVGSVYRKADLLLTQSSAKNNESGYEVTLTDSDYFIKDHRIQGDHILPGSIYFELASRVFSKKISLDSPEKSIICLSNIVLLRPLSVTDGSIQAHISMTDGEINSFEIFTENVDSSDEDHLVHCRGDIQYLDREEPSRISLDDIREEYKNKKIDKETFYSDFNDLDINYGPAFQGFKTLYSKPGAVLAKLRLPELIEDTLDDYSMHPIIVDCAMQCLKCLSAGDDDGEAQLLFAIQKIQILSPFMTDMWAWMRYADSTSKKINIDIINQDDIVCARIEGISTRPVVSTNKPTSTVQQYPPVFLVPKWDKLSQSGGDIWPSTDSKLVIIDCDKNTQKILDKFYGSTEIIQIKSESNSVAIAELLSQQANIDHIIWCAPKAMYKLPSANKLANGQYDGAIKLFRIIKALIQLGYGSESLGLTIITNGVQTINNQEIADPTHSSISGMVGSIAKEYPNWKIRAVDILELTEDTLEATLALPSDPLGNTCIYRHKQWYNQVLLSVPELLQNKPSLFVKQGVYLIVGGAGGLGVAISEYLIKTYQAQIIWLGRRKKDSLIEKNIDLLSKLGPEPMYVQADATSADSLSQAHAEIRKYFNNINGLIQSAMILDSASLDKMTEKQFHDVLAAKVDVSARLVDEFKDNQLDFVLFISTINSYLKAMGQSNYSAACTFKDGFSLRLDHELKCPVRVVNMGYCFNNIENEDGSFDENEMIDFIERDDFYNGLDIILSSDIKQVTFMKFSPKWSTRGIVLGDDECFISDSDNFSAIKDISTMAEVFDHENNTSPDYRKAVQKQNDLLIEI